MQAKWPLFTLGKLGLTKGPRLLTFRGADASSLLPEALRVYAQARVIPFTEPALLQLRPLATEKSLPDPCHGRALQLFFHRTVFSCNAAVEETLNAIRHFGFEYRCQVFLGIFFECRSHSNCRS